VHLEWPFFRLLTPLALCLISGLSPAQVPDVFQSKIDNLSTNLPTWQYEGSMAAAVSSE
jgi:hypothetical protein